MVKKKKKQLKKWHPHQCNPQLLVWFSKYKKHPSTAFPELFKKKSLSFPLPKIPGHKGENGYVILKTQKGRSWLTSQSDTDCLSYNDPASTEALHSATQRWKPSSLSQNYTNMRTPEQTHTHTHTVAAWLAGLLWTTLFTQMILWSLVLIVLVSCSAFTHVLLLVWWYQTYPNVWLLVLFVCLFLSWNKAGTCTYRQVFERQNYGICEAKLNKCYVWSDCFLFVCGLK